MTNLRAHIGKVSDSNSSSTVLGISEVFTGTAIEIDNDAAIIFVNVISDVVSAIDGLEIQQSSNGTNWDHLDNYTVPANTGKNYSINPNSKWFRVIYTNGSVGQSFFRLQTIIKNYNSKPSSHRIKDDITSDDDAELIKAVTVVETNDEQVYKNVNVQNPMPTDSDSIYAKDLHNGTSNIGTFTGTIDSLFDNYEIEIIDNSATNPKTFTIGLQRPMTTTSFGMGSSTGDFSNVKLLFKDMSDTIRLTVDNSSNSTKFTSNVYQFTPVTFIKLVVEFHTTDPVRLNGAFSPKDVPVVSRIQALKPDGTITDIDATNGGNLKISVEELESGISVNANSQLKVTQFDSSGNEILPLSQALLDSKGRLRHSNFMGTGHDTPSTVFDTKQIFDNNPQFWDDVQVSGSGTTSVHSVNKASSTLGVGDTTAGIRTRQTFMWHNYQPAKIQHIIQTGTLIDNGGGSGIKIYAGELNDENGVAFFYDEGIIKTLIRSKTSGSVIDTVESQFIDWDDPMDGSGRSEKTINFTKGHVFGITYGWLGFDAVIFWVKIGGEPYVVNIMEGDNIANVPYMSTPNLPLRWSIENDSTGAASTTIHQCSTVISEGGQQDIGELRYLSTSGTHIVCASENTVYALIGIRLKAANFGASIKIIDIAIATNTASGHFEWFLVFNPTVTGTFTYSDITNSSIQGAIGTGTGATVTFNPKDVITGGLSVAGSGSVKFGKDEKGIEDARRIGSNIAGTEDTMVLCLRPIMGATNIDIEATMTRREIN